MNSSKTVDKKIFWPAIALVAALTIPLALNPGAGGEIVNGLLKACTRNFGWLFLLFARPHPQHGVRKVYRWAGTLPGSLVLVVAVPVGVFLFGVLTLLIADLLGY